MYLLQLSTSIHEFGYVQFYPFLLHEDWLSSESFSTSKTRTLAIVMAVLASTYIIISRSAYYTVVSRGGRLEYNFENNQSINKLCI